MDKKLVEILKKAKAVDRAVDQKMGKVRTSTQSYQEPPIPNMTGVDSDQLISYEEAQKRGLVESSQNINHAPKQMVDPNSNIYADSVKNSNLPDAIKRAMLTQPINPQDALGLNLSEDVIREIAPEKFTQRRQPQPRQTQTNESISFDSNSVDINLIRKIMAEEIEKVLPKVIKDYFDERVIKESIQFKAGNTTFSGTVSPLPKKRTKKRL